MIKEIENLMKFRTKGSIESIAKKLSGYDFESILNTLYAASEDEKLKNLMRLFEKQFLLVKTDMPKFRLTLHSFYKNTSNVIKRDHLQRKFMEYMYFVNNYYVKKSDTNDIVNAYMDFLIQQKAYLVPTKVIYGIQANGKFMVRNEIYPNYDLPLYELMTGKIKEPLAKLAKSDPLLYIKKRLQSYGYDIPDSQELMSIPMKEQVITNMIDDLSYLIDENYQDMVPEKYYYPTHEPILPQIKTDCSFFINKIKGSRRYIIPQSGVTAIYKNAGDISEIFFREKIFSNRSVMLYKIKVEADTYSTGYFDPLYNCVETIFRSSNRRTEQEQLSAFIMQSYFCIVCDIAEEDKPYIALNIVKNIDEPIDVSNIPSVEFSYNKNTSVEDNSGTVTHSYLKDKSKYTLVEKSINPYIRKLPLGYKASDAAIARARELGIQLAPDETFVRDFEKHVRKVI